MPDADAPRPPDGDWMGTPYLRFERRGSIAVCTVDRPHRRNAMTPAMYFGVRYAVDHVNRSDDLAALVITGTDDVFIVGGDLGGGQGGQLGRPRPAAPHGQHAVRRGAQLPQAGGLGRQRHLPGRRADHRHALRHRRRLPRRHLPGPRDPPGHRRHRLRGRTCPARSASPAPATCCSPASTIDAPTALDWGLVTRMAEPGDELDAALDLAAQIARGAPGARRVVKREINRRYVRYDRMSMEESLYGPRAHRGVQRLQGAPQPRLGARGPPHRGSAVIRSWVDDGVGRVHLDDAEHRNVLSLEHSQAIAAAIAGLRRRRRHRVERGRPGVLLGRRARRPHLAPGRR